MQAASQNLNTLRENTVKVFREGQGSRPDVLLIEFDGDEFVLKDFDGCDRWFAVVLGRFLCAREFRALKALAGIDGIPNGCQRVGPRALRMQYAPGVPVDSEDLSKDWGAYFEDLARLIDAMHATGVTHCDLRSPGNALIDTSNRAWLVDFTGSWRKTMLNGWLFRQLAWVDRSAIIKMKHRVAPQCISTQEAEVEARGHPLETPARRCGEFVRWLTQKVLTRRS